jgi:NAD(P)-dependent dehydrogenase (short-subunit alcohol dehydrogenase family)
MMSALAGKTAVVTGAAGGIGRAIVVSLARRGCNLVLSDIDETGLEETRRLIGSGVAVSCHCLDVADSAAVATFPAAVSARHGAVHLLVNNAGVALGGTFEQISADDFEWLFAINFWGVVRMTRAFLPLLKASGSGQLVNLSSLFGLIAPPGQSAYAASKFAVRGFSEALRHELEPEGIGVTVVHPGGVATAITRNARKAPGSGTGKSFQAMLKLPAEVAGEIIVRGVERRAPRILVGADAKIAALVERLAPTAHWNLLRRFVRT